MSTQLQQLHAIVSGRVQGVNFRTASQRAAQRLGLAGWVRNLPDGTVEVLAEGPRGALDELAAFLHHGPPAAVVAQVTTAWLDPSGAPHDFEVRW